MLIECAYCDSNVDAMILGEHKSFRIDDPFPFKVTLLECPVCKNAILAGQEFYEVGTDKYEWNDAKRLWPRPEKYLNWNLPKIVRNALEEAQKCYKAKAYSACTVMCYRGLDRICAEYNTKNKLLSGGLKELLNKHIIDRRIYEWGEVIKENCNIDEPPTNEKIFKDEARDLLDFTIAICDYIFVLTNKYESFMKRKEKI